MTLTLRSSPWDEDAGGSCRNRVRDNADDDELAGSSGFGAGRFGRRPRDRRSARRPVFRDFRHLSADRAGLPRSGRAFAGTAGLRPAPSADRHSGPPARLPAPDVVPAPARKGRGVSASIHPLHGPELGGGTRLPIGRGAPRGYVRHRSHPLRRPGTDEKPGVPAAGAAGPERAKGPLATKPPAQPAAADPARTGFMRRTKTEEKTTLKSKA